PKFSLLPTEIRPITWKFARPSPRIIKLSRSTSQIAGCRFQHLVSRIPVPNLLHAYYESRSLALRWYTLLFRPRCGYGWYKLGLHSKLTKPRVYFDFDSDYLYVGCNECGAVSFCRDCTNKVVFEDCLAVKRVLVHWAPRGNSPFFSLHLCLRGVKEVLLFNPSADPLNPDTELAHLQETTKPFDWQEGKSLYDVFLEEKPKLDQYCMDSVTILQAQAKDLGPLYPTKIARVE
ncbi:hypothetical protein BGZ57DRAFT_725508, partial [Hyaloscypha finlandica]